MAMTILKDIIFIYFLVYKKNMTPDLFYKLSSVC